MLSLYSKTFSKVAVVLRRRFLWKLVYLGKIRLLVRYLLILDLEAKWCTDMSPVLYHCMLSLVIPSRCKSEAHLILLLPCLCDQMK